MKLQRLTLSNFKGIRYLELDAQGQNVSVYGENAAGKTTLADGFMWLLFDKDSQNRKDFEIKTLDASGNPIHNLNHEVEATLEIGTRQITLKKVLYEKWTKKRGSATAEFTGHTTDYYVDGVPVKKSEYQAAVAEIADESIFRLLTDPTYFNEQMHWSDRRSVLLEICGDITDADVISGDASLKNLPEILGNRTLDQHRKVIVARRAEINRELERIPVRIDEVQRSLPAADFNISVLQSELDRFRNLRQEVEEEGTRIKSGGQVSQLENQRRQIDGAILDLENRLRAGVDVSTQVERQQVSLLAQQMDDKYSEYRRLTQTIKDSKLQVEQAQAKIISLREQWHQVNDRQFTLSQTSTCPTCGQSIPEWQLDEAKSKAQAEFNLKKASELEQINAEGKRLKEQVGSLEIALASDQSVAETLEQEASQLKAQIDKLQMQIRRSISAAPSMGDNPEYKQLLDRRSTLSSEISALQINNTGSLSLNAARINNINQDINRIEKDMAQIQLRENGLKRIDELQAEERCLAAEYEKLERELYLTEQFITTKVRLLEERINSRFQMARFKLFNTLVNGGIEECCETTYHGVPYSNLNHGAQLNVGLDIINTLAGHYKFTPPVWIDNSESVLNILPTTGQQIRLVVSAGDKALRVELDGTNTQREAA